MELSFFLIYFLAISLAAIALCIYDKQTAVSNSKREKKRRRTPEKTLFIVAALGGSAAMLATMLIIRHKTQHKRFMIGLPLIMAAQIGLGVLIKLFAMNIFPAA